MARSGQGQQRQGWRRGGRAGCQAGAEALPVGAVQGGLHAHDRLGLFWCTVFQTADSLNTLSLSNAGGQGPLVASAGAPKHRPAGFCMTWSDSRLPTVLLHCLSIACIACWALYLDTISFWDRSNCCPPCHRRGVAIVHIHSGERGDLQCAHHGPRGAAAQGQGLHAPAHQPGLHSQAAFLGAAPDAHDDAASDLHSLQCSVICTLQQPQRLDRCDDAYDHSFVQSSTSIVHPSIQSCKLGNHFWASQDILLTTTYRPIHCFRCCCTEDALRYGKDVHLCC